VIDPLTLAINAFREDGRLSSHLEGWVHDIVISAITEDRKQIARMLQAGADEWEATGDDEKFVNEIVDPFIIETLR
jgi:hypothetical protein